MLVLFLNGRYPETTLHFTNTNCHLTQRELGGDILLEGRTLHDSTYGD